MASRKSIMTFQLKQKLTTTWLSVLISNDIFFNIPCVFTDASIVLKSNDWKNIEMMVASAAAWTMTITSLTQRWLTQDESKISDPLLRKERGVWTIWYVTILAFDAFDRNWENDINGSIFFSNGKFRTPDFLTTWQRDAVYTSPQNWDKAFVVGVGEQVYSGGAWQTLGIWTPVPNSSTTVAGIVQEATLAEVIAATWTGTTGARLFLNPSLIKWTSAWVADAWKVVRLNASGKVDNTMLNPTTFKVIAAVGWDYTTVSAAINAGETSLYVKSWTYTEAWRTLSSWKNVYILGEDASSCILDFTAPAAVVNHINISNGWVSFNNITINCALTDTTYKFLNAASSWFVDFSNWFINISSTCVTNFPEFLSSSQLQANVYWIIFNVNATGTKLVAFGTWGSMTNYIDCYFSWNKISFSSNSMLINCRGTWITSLNINSCSFIGGSMSSITQLTDTSGVLSGWSILKAVSGFERIWALNSSGVLSIAYCSESILDFNGGNATTDIVNAFVWSKLRVSAQVSISWAAVRIAWGEIRTGGSNIIVSWWSNQISWSTIELWTWDMVVSSTNNSITWNSFVSIWQLQLTVASSLNTVIWNTWVAASIVDSGSWNITAAWANPLNT